MAVVRATRNGSATLAVTNLAVAGPPLCTVNVHVAVAGSGTTLGHERPAEMSASREGVAVGWFTGTVKGPAVAVPAPFAASTE